MVTNQMTTEQEEEDDYATSSNDFSNESQTTDYTSIEGLRTKLGIDNDQFFSNFIIKELMDNAKIDVTIPNNDII